MTLTSQIVTADVNGDIGTAFRGSITDGTGAASGYSTGESADFSRGNVQNSRMFPGDHQCGAPWSTSTREDAIVNRMAVLIFNTAWVSLTAAWCMLLVKTGAWLILNL